MEKIQKVFLNVAGLVFLATLVYAEGETPSAAMIENGKKISFEYTLTVDGEVVDSNVGKEPIVYTQGDGQIISGLETQLAGLHAGDAKSVTVKPEDGYGLEDPNAIQEVPRSNFPTEQAPEVGMVIELQGDDGRSVPGIIKEVLEDKILVNFNHPLAGKTLQFDVKIVSIE